MRVGGGGYIQRGRGLGGCKSERGVVVGMGDGGEVEGRDEGEGGWGGGGMRGRRGCDERGVMGVRAEGRII